METEREDIVSDAKFETWIKLGADEEAAECANRASEEFDARSLERLWRIMGETAPGLAVDWAEAE